MNQHASPETSEADLIEAARQGDGDAFAELFHRHKGYVLRLASRFGVEGDETWDLLQDAFVVFFKKLPSFERRAKLSTYLYPTVKFLALKRKSRFFRRHRTGADEALVRMPAKESLSASLRRVAETVSALPEGQREVVLLRFVDGFSLNEIAVALAIPQGTVKSRLHNAILLLRKNAEEEK